MPPPDWTPTSWRTLAAAQQPSYRDPVEVETVLARLRVLPPLVASAEVNALKAQLAEAAVGKRFILQGGDCAERFADCNTQSILRKLKIILQMSLVLTYGARRPVIRLGRIAGQFAKPRSNDTELVNGVSLPVYRGDNVNDLEATAEKRRPDPERLERGYYSAAATLNFIRGLIRAGFASLRSPEHWQLDFLPASETHKGFREIAERIRDAIDYFESLGPVSPNLKEVDFYTSHEALVLPYEEALTRFDEDSERFYNLGAHFIWIGERTRALDGAHVEYFRGLANPIGIKVSSSATPDSLRALIEKVDPSNEAGRVTLITRFGHEKIASALPPLVRAVRAAGKRVGWSCDPMHGNSQTVEGFKTRDFSHILTELTHAFQIHHAEGSHLAGVHFELTGENVTECLGGAKPLSRRDLEAAYQTGCDPRLNYAQSMEMAFLISQLLVDTKR